MPRPDVLTELLEQAGWARGRGSWICRKGGAILHCRYREKGTTISMEFRHLQLTDSLPKDKNADVINHGWWFIQQIAG